MRKTVLVTAIVVFSNVAGNFSLSWGVKHSSQGAFALASPWVMLGVALLIVWTLARMALLSWADLSFVLPVTSAGYVLTALASRFFLHEEISWQRWAGTALIMLGVILVGGTDPRTARASEKRP
jgi:drug/metabolite transporter (DMT)-like permease